MAAAGRWSDLKVVIDTTQKAVAGYIKSGSGQWIQLNETPIPYLEPKAIDSTLCINIGSQKYSKSNYLPVPERFDNNVLELDNIRIMQILPDSSA